MSKKSRQTGNNRNTIVFSTDPSFRMDNDDLPAAETLEPKLQKLKVLLDKKQRAGKMVSIVTGFVGTEVDLEQLGKELKTYCGSGGSVKDQEIIIQGDQRDKIVDFLVKKGYGSTKKL